MVEADPHGQSPSKPFQPAAGIVAGIAGRFWIEKRLAFELVDSRREGDFEAIQIEVCTLNKQDRFQR